MKYNPCLINSINKLKEKISYERNEKNNIDCLKIKKEKKKETVYKKQAKYNIMIKIKKAATICSQNGASVYLDFINQKDKREFFKYETQLKETDIIKTDDKNITDNEKKKIKKK